MTPQNMPLFYLKNDYLMRVIEHKNVAFILNLLFIAFVSTILSSCNGTEPKNGNSDNDRHKEEIAQKNLELELKQKELELKAQELEILQQHQEKEDISKQYNATELFEKYNRSVFKIFVLNDTKELHSTGTGFLIGDDGYAVTNYHVLQNANYAYIELINGDIIDINFDKIVGYNNQDDFVIFKLETTKNIKGFEDYSDVPIKNGTTVFTIGNPSGGESNTISQGIITGQNGKDLQFSAPIDHGSSGSPLFNNQGQIVGLVWGGKHDGNLYKAVKIMHLDLSRFIEHDWSNYDENDDPNLAGPFMGESSSGKVIWAIGKTQEEAVSEMNSSNNIMAIDFAVDGNGAWYGVEKHHDPRYGQIKFDIFGLPEDVWFRLNIHGKEMSTKNVKYINFNNENSLLSLVVLFEDGSYLSLLTGYDKNLFKEYGHLE